MQQTSTSSSKLKHVTLKKKSKLEIEKHYYRIMIYNLFQNTQCSAKKLNARVEQKMRFATRKNKIVQVHF